MDEVEKGHLFRATTAVDQLEEKKKKSRRKRASENHERKQNLEQLQKQMAYLKSENKILA